MKNAKQRNAGIFLAQGGMVAALYVALTLIASAMGLASGQIQLRLSEALTILPCFFPEAVPGLFVGCLLANLLTGCVLWDVAVGSLATLLGALGTLLLVPPVLAWAYGVEESIPFLMLTVGLGEVLSCGVLGELMYSALDKRRALWDRKDR